MSCLPRSLSHCLPAGLISACLSCLPLQPSLHDFLIVLPDSLSAFPDSLPALPDSQSALPDSLPALPDSLPAILDSWIKKKN
jgi:hypothetical protein